MATDKWLGKQRDLSDRDHHRGDRPVKDVGTTELGPKFGFPSAVGSP